MKKHILAVISFVLFSSAALLQLAARNITGFAEWYAVTVYPCIVGIYGRFCNIFPISVVEISIYALILFTAAFLVFCRKQWKRLLEGVLAFLGLIAFLFTVNCGINYYRRPFSSYLDLKIQDSSVEELEELCAYLVDRINETADDYGQPGLAEQFALSRQGQEAMENLGTEYPQLAGYYPRPKPVLVSWILAVQQLCGIYSPFTVEANYNWQMTGYNIPHTLCHELSHLRGFMREDEANFIGYLACIHSQEDFFRYSGYLMGWVHAGNALAAQDRERYMELHNKLVPQAVEDLRANNAYWDQYEGKTAEVANQINDTYLKLNDQADGVKSYGRVVDLMLAYYRGGEE